MLRVDANSCSSNKAETRSGRPSILGRPERGKSVMLVPASTEFPCQPPHSRLRWRLFSIRLAQFCPDVLVRLPQKNSEADDGAVLEGRNSWSGGHFFVRRRFFRVGCVASLHFLVSSFFYLVCVYAKFQPRNFISLGEKFSDKDFFYNLYIGLNYLCFNIYYL